jgi:hypothetical protein
MGDGGKVYQLTFPDANGIKFAFNPALNINSYELRGYYEFDIEYMEYRDDITNIIAPNIYKVKLVRESISQKNQYYPKYTKRTYQTESLPIEQLRNFKPIIQMFYNSRITYQSDVKFVIDGLIVFNSLNYSGKKNNSYIFKRTFKTKFDETNNSTDWGPKNKLSSCPNDRYEDIPFDAVITNPQIHQTKYVTYETCVFCWPPYVNRYTEHNCGMPNPMDYYAWNSININTSITYPYPARFHAKETTINDGVTLSGEITVDTESPYGYLPPVQPVTIDNNFLQSFCKSDVSNGIDYSQGLRYNAYHSNKDFRLAQDEEASIQTSKPNTVRNITHLTAIPNPATGTTTFYFNLLEESTTVELYLTDIVGKRVANVLLPQTRTQGTYQESFDISNLARGIYLFTLQTNTSKETQRLIVE